MEDRIMIATQMLVVILQADLNQHGVGFVHQNKESVT